MYSFKFNFLMIIVFISGKPRPEIMWTKDGQDVSEKKRFKMSDTESGAQLKIKNAKVEDGGKYSVTAVNKGGEASCDFQLTVEKKKK